MKAIKKFLILFIFLSFVQLMYSHEKVRQTEKQLEQTKKIIHQKTKEKEKYIKKEKTIQNELERIEKELKNIEVEKRKIENEITQAKVSLEALKKNIEIMNSDLEFYGRILKISLNNFVYKHFVVNPFLEENFNRRVKENIIRKYAEQISRIKLKKNYAEILKEQQEIKKRKLENLSKQLENKKEKQRKLFLEKNKLLAQISIKKTQIEKEIKELIATQKELEKILNKLKKEKRKEVFLYSQQKPSTPIINRIFIKPISGEIVCKFGKEQINQDGSCIVRNGVIIQGISFDNVVSVEDGKVIFISQNFRSYGKLIIIEHKDNIHSIYGQLKEILVLEGQYVKKGQVIAKTDSSGQIYFELRKDFICVNPELYLE